MAASSALAASDQGFAIPVAPLDAASLEAASLDVASLDVASLDATSLDAPALALAELASADDADPEPDDEQPASTRIELANMAAAISPIHFFVFALISMPSIPIVAVMPWQ